MKKILILFVLGLFATLSNIKANFPKSPEKIYRIILNGRTIEKRECINLLYNVLLDDADPNLDYRYNFKNGTLIVEKNPIAPGELESYARR